MPPHSERLASGIRWSAVRQIVLTVIGTAAVLTYTRTLGPAGMGTFTFAAIFYTGLLLLVQAPFRDAVIYFQSKSHENAAFFSMIGVALPAAAALLLLAPTIGRYYDAPAAIPILQGMVVVFLFRTLAVVPAAVLLKRFNFKTHEGVQLISEIVFAAVILGGLLLFSLGVEVLVYAHLAAAAVWLVLVWVYTRFWPTTSAPRDAYLDVWRFARALVGSQALKYANLNIDQILVGRLGDNALGLYSFGESQSSFIVIGVGIPMFQITLPALARLKDEPVPFKTTLLRMTRLTHAASMPYHLFVFVLAHPFVMLLFGEAWLPAVPLLRAYLIFRLLQTLGELGDATLSALGRPVIRFYFDLILLPLFGATAYLTMTLSADLVVIAGGLAAVRTLLMIAYLAITMRLAQVSAGLFWSAVRGPTVAAVVGGLVILGVNMYWTAGLGVGGSGEGSTLVLAVRLTGLAIVGILTYLGTFFILDRPGFKDVLAVVSAAFFPFMGRESREK